MNSIPQVPNLKYCPSRYNSGQLLKTLEDMCFWRAYYFSMGRNFEQESDSHRATATHRCLVMDGELAEIRKVLLGRESGEIFIVAISEGIGREAGAKHYARIMS